MSQCKYYLWYIYFAAVKKNRTFFYGYLAIQQRCDLLKEDIRGGFSFSSRAKPSSLY
ncbi:hypothetical protein DSUL_60185 [Desulfovibrionales bacterium]